MAAHRTRRTYTRRQPEAKPPAKAPVLAAVVFEGDGEAPSPAISAPEDHRPAMRAEARPSDSRERARLRAAQLREHGSLDDGTDKYALPSGIVPDGWSYEWKRKSLLGKEDPSYDMSVANNGWEPVELSRHPDLMPKGYRGETIERDGMILMERPDEITRESRERDQRDALQPLKDIRARMTGVPEGQFERTPAKVNREYRAPQAVP